jgi:hypothetical protein
MPDLHSLRFPDRDMLMRFQWGLAVGHRYTHGDAIGQSMDQESTSDSTIIPSANASSLCVQESLPYQVVVSNPTEEALDLPIAVDEHGGDIEDCDMEMGEDMNAGWEDDEMAFDGGNFAPTATLSDNDEVDDEMEREFELFADGF